MEYDEQDELGVLDPNIRKQLREAEKVAKEAAEAKAALATLQREIAFTKAGVPEEGAGALLRKAYDGDITPEAIKAAAQTYGILSQPAETPLVEDQELASMRRVAGAATGAGAANTADASTQFLSELNSASSEADAYAVITRYATSNPEFGIVPKGLQ